MECAKDIILEVKEGQVSGNAKKGKRGFIHHMLDKIARHKVMVGIVLTTMIFIVLDVVLISSFVSVLV